MNAYILQIKSPKIQVPIKQLMIVYLKNLRCTRKLTTSNISVNYGYPKTVMPKSEHDMASNKIRWASL